MRKGNRRLNFTDRQTIERMHAAGVKVSAIADEVGVHIQRVQGTVGT